MPSASISQRHQREAGIARQRTETVTKILDQSPFERLQGGGKAQSFLKHHVVPFDAKESNLDDSPLWDLNGVGCRASPLMFNHLLTAGNPTPGRSFIEEEADADDIATSAFA
jgi:hypothetical protein